MTSVRKDRRRKIETILICQSMTFSIEEAVGGNEPQSEDIDVDSEPGAQDVAENEDKCVEGEPRGEDVNNDDYIMSCIYR